MKQEAVVAGTKRDEANLILRLYEMRRDEDLRRARERFDTEFNPQTAQDVAELSAGETDRRVHSLHRQRNGIPGLYYIRRLN